jgi:hypothetical protein
MIDPDFKMSTHFEWTCEVTDEHDDIIDTFEIDQRDVVECCDKPAHRVALVRRRGCEADGETERGYAYILHGRLPATFCDGNKVPQKYHKIVDRLFD